MLEQGERIVSDHRTQPVGQVWALASRNLALTLAQQYSIGSRLGEQDGMDITYALRASIGRCTGRPCCAEALSGTTINRYLRRQLPLAFRWVAREVKSAQDGVVLTEAQVAAGEHGQIEAKHPGYLVEQDTDYVGTLKGIGRLYQQTTINPYSRVSTAKLYLHRVDQLWLLWTNGLHLAPEATV